MRRAERAVKNEEEIREIKAVGIIKVDVEEFSCKKHMKKI